MLLVVKAIRKIVTGTMKYLLCVCLLYTRLCICVDCTRSCVCVQELSYLRAVLAVKRQKPVENVLPSLDEAVNSHFAALKA